MSTILVLCSLFQAESLFQNSNFGGKYLEFDLKSSNYQKILYEIDKKLYLYEFPEFRKTKCDIVNKSDFSSF